MTKAIAIVVILSILTGIGIYLDKNGYNRAKLEYSEIANKALQESAEKLLKSQGKVTSLTDENNEAKLNEQIKSSNLESTIKKLRASSNNCDANFAHYRLFNEASRSPNLPKSNHLQEPAQEKDGLDTVQYTVREYNLCAIQLNTVTDVLGGLECVVIAD